MGPWDPDRPVPTGRGGFLTTDVPVDVKLSGKLARPARSKVFLVGPHIYGMRAPQSADFETMFGFPPPEGTLLTRATGAPNGQAGEILLFQGGRWNIFGVAGQNPTEPPVAAIGEAWGVEFGGPGFFSPPEDQHIVLGERASFHVDAAGAPPLTYSWFKTGSSGVPLATGDTLTLEAVLPADLGSYYVEVTDQAGMTTSRPARLAADGSLRIVSGTATPANPVALGRDVTLSVIAVGDGELFYQWFRNGRPVPGETRDTLILHNLAPSDGGRYSVRVNDSFSTVFGAGVPVVPDVPLVPFSDAFLGGSQTGGAFTNGITGNNGAGRGRNTDATAETGEHNHAGLPARNSEWVSWVPTASGIATFDTAGSSFDTRLAIYQAAVVGPLGVANLLLVTENDDADLGVRTSRVSFNATAGTRYFIAVDGGGREQGDILLSWNLEVTTQRLPEIARQPLSQNLALNQLLKLVIEAPVEPGTEQQFSWFRNGQSIPGVLTGTLDLGVVTEDKVGKYLSEIRQLYPDGTSRLIRSVIAEVQLYRRSNGSDPGLRAFDRLSDVFNQLGRGGSRNALPGRAGHLQGLARGVSGTQVFSSVGETVDPDEPVHCGVPGGASKWYPLPCDVDGIVTLDTAGSTFDTVLAVYYDTGLGVGVYDGLRAVECNNDASAVDHTSAVTFCAKADNIYMIAVGGATGTVKLNYKMSTANPGSTCPRPAVTCPLRVAQRVATQGTTVVLAAQVAGTEPLTLSWYRDGTLVQGDASTVLVLSNVTAAAAGAYSLRVANADGMVEQVVAQLTLVTGDQPRLGFEEACDGSLKFTVAGAKNVEYVVESSTDLQTWLSLFSGSSANGVLELPVLNPQEAGGKRYRARKK